VKIYDGVFKRLGLSYLVLQRPDFDKFPGAAYSLAFDAWNPDGKVNQIGTVHNLGENFAKAFEITYEDLDGNQRPVVQTCYGFGISRTLAAIIAQHGDDHGLVLPPETAPTQVVIVPIPYKGVETEIVTYSKKILETLKEAGFKVVLDDREKLQPGEKFYYWEMLGVPVRVEVGPRDLKENHVTLSRRDTLERSTVPFDRMVPAIHELFSKIMENLRERSRKVLEDRIVRVGDIKALKRAIRQRKIAQINWCENEECAEKIKGEGGGEVRGHRFNAQEEPMGLCLICGKKAKKQVYVARAY